jgi:site-specific recombinase XerD
MTEEPIIPQARQLASVGIHGVPALFVDAGEKAWWRFVEFFTANIRNKNTREAYGRAVVRFSFWCADKKIDLHQLNPFLVAAYIEDLGLVLSRPSVKQHLAAIRMLFDFLVIGQIVPMNPASSVRGPKHVVKKGKTPVLTAEEARTLLDSIDIATIAGLRDRAMIAVMVFSFARIGAVVAMNVEDYFQQGKRMWFRLHEKGGKLHDVPSHHKAEEYVDAYIAASNIIDRKGSALFCRLDRHRHLTGDRIERREALAMIKRRARDAGLPDSISCHTFRATGITAYLLNGGTLEKAQQIASHESPRTTKLYDRTSDEVSLDEIEKILI